MGCVGQKQVSPGPHILKIKQQPIKEPEFNIGNAAEPIPNENVMESAVADLSNQSSNRSGRPQWITDFEKAKQIETEGHKAQVNESKIDIVVSTTVNEGDILPHKLDINKLLKLPSIVQLQEPQVNKQKVARQLFPKQHFQNRQTKSYSNTNPTQNQLIGTAQDHNIKRNRTFGTQNNPKMALLTIRCRVVSTVRQ